MQTVMPILIILALSGCSTALSQRWISKKWLNILAGTLVASFLWIIGVYIMLWLTAPNELGFPVFSAIICIFLTAFVSAAVVAAISPKKQKDSGKENDCNE